MGLKEQDLFAHNVEEDNPKEHISNHTRHVSTRVSLLARSDSNRFRTSVGK